MVALGRLPEQPSALYKIESASSQTSIAVAWDQVPDIDSIPTTGYKLLMDDGLNGQFQVVYDGSTDYHTRQFTAVGLETGIPYRFKVIAVNINGESPESDEFTINACLRPSDNGLPFKIDTTKTTITIGWDEPNSQGCPLTGFSILRDGGVRDDIVIEVEPGIVENKPSMREYQITGLTLPGNTYRFIVRAFNDAGSSDSGVLSVILSAVPDTPASGPTSDASVTNESRIKVNFGPQSASENGGSPVLSYDLQVDYGHDDDFLSVIGGEGMDDSLETRYTIETNIVSGNMYRFRYRSRNANGWSAYSPISYIKAATKPTRPPAPIFLDATATSVVLRLFQTPDDGGDEVASYQLYRNEGGTSTDYILVGSYDGSALTHTVTAAEDGLVPSTVYKFRYQAVNAYGESDMSDEVNAGVSSFPAKPNAVRKVAVESSETSITLEWDASADTELPVLGYLVSMNDGSDVEYVRIYDGTNFPNVRKFLATGLQTGTTASFTVQALNYNGASEASDPADFIICQPPSQFSPPTMPAVTKTAMTLEWQAPVSDGGCPVSSFYLYADDGAGGAFVEID